MNEEKNKEETPMVEEKPTPKPQQPKKELTPAEIQKRKKLVIMPLIFLVFGAAMWLIFAPSGEKDKEQTSGFNSDIPMPKENGIISNKRDAYEKEALEKKDAEKMHSLQDFAFALGEGEEDLSKEGSEDSASKPAKAIQSSASAYRDINNQMDNFYDQPATEVDEQSQLALEFRIQELERKETEKSDTKRLQDEQLQMVEKSYQIAAKYMPGAMQGTPQSDEALQSDYMTDNSSREKAVAQPVRQIRENVVSILATPVSDSVFIADYSQPRNLGFNTAAGNERVQDKNSIRACVYQTVTIKNGQEVTLRLLEPMQAGNIRIPSNSLITATGKITGERLNMAVGSIQNAGNIIPVEMQVYDTDGMQGISIPGSEEMNAVKEIAANMGSSAGTSVSFSNNAGSQFAADLGKSVIQGASQLIGKKIRTVKVTLKANYQLLLLPKE